MYRAVICALFSRKEQFSRGRLRISILSLRHEAKKQHYPTTLDFRARFTMIFEIPQSSQDEEEEWKRRRYAAWPQWRVYPRETRAYHVAHLVRNHFQPDRPQNPGGLITFARPIRSLNHTMGQHRPLHCPPPPLSLSRSRMFLWQRAQSRVIRLIFNNASSAAHVPPRSILEITSDVSRGRIYVTHRKGN